MQKHSLHFMIEFTCPVFFVHAFIAQSADVNVLCSFTFYNLIYCIVFKTQIVHLNFSKPNNTFFSSLLSDLEKTLEAKKQEFAKNDQKLKEKDKEVATLQKENAKTKAELKEEKNKINGVINENEKLRQNLDETKKKVEELKEIISEKKEPPKSEWPRFDANTAHRRLMLSQDEKEARTSLFPQPVPDTPERYDTAIAALGKDGFDSGKHYWEIGVIGRNCYVVGAARASAQRKGILRYGPSAGYWVIQKNRGSKLFANADAPSVIGVQLDFKNNKVIFYDAVKKLEIFSFTGNELQGKIHPYVETCSDTNLNPPLILKKPQSTDWLKQ